MKPTPLLSVKKRPVKITKPLNDNCVLVGRGVFSWFRSERTSDRYGSCYTEGEMWFPEEGQRGQLVAIINEARNSGHIGDIGRGIYPVKPKVGDAYLLGEGAATKVEAEGTSIVAFGLKPDDGRSHDWLNPYHLYRCHDSVVELRWYPSK